ncbi:SRPBCC family protein [Flavitalea antarctica]
MELNTQIIINATPGRVWAVLTDFENYRTWNPFIISITGEPKAGSQIKVTVLPPQGKKMTFRPTVLVFEHNKEFRWKGRLFFNGLFDGEHQFELVDNGNDTTLFYHCETFKGLLVRLFKNQLENNTKKGFELMNQHLKKVVETNNSLELP